MCTRDGARAHECLRHAVDSACPRAGASAPLSGMDGRRRPLPCTNASRLLLPVDSLLETEVQNIVAFLEARANVQEYANNGARRRCRRRSVARRHTEHGRGAASQREMPPPPPRNLNLP